MRCKACNYPLWQITARNCPECGTGFKPSEFEFVVNSVRFCCPHCAQVYYGTGPTGHLEPPAFACVSCAKPVQMDEMVLLPASNVTEDQTQGRHVPWVERRSQSWFGAFFSTWGLGIGSPVGLIEGVNESLPLRRALVYGWIHMGLQFAFGMWWAVAFAFVLAASITSGLGKGLSLTVVAIVFVLVLPPVVLLAWIGVSHLLLRITGPTSAGFARTGHAICFSAGNNFISAIPCIGFYFGWLGGLWWAITAGFMLAKAQRVSGVRAGFAVAIPVVLAAALTVGAFFAMAFSPGAAFAVPPAPVAAPSSHAAPGDAAASMANAFINRSTTGPLDAHAAMLIYDGDLSAEDFLLPGSNTTTGTATVNGTPLMSFEAYDTSLLPVIRSQRTPGQHRVGDFIFVCAGIDPSNAEAELWLAIGWPDPAFNTAPIKEVELAKTRGEYEVIPIEDFSKRLAEQNAQRRRLGLSEIVDPRPVP